MQIQVEKIIGKSYNVWKVADTLDKYEPLRNFMNTHVHGEPFGKEENNWILVHEDEYKILKQGIELFGYEEVYSARDRKPLFTNDDGTVVEVWV